MLPSTATLALSYRRLSPAGREDIIVRSEQALELQKKMPHATVRLVPEAGHMVHYFVADEIFETAEVKQMEAA